MDVKYITVKANKLATVPIVDGQIIAISDKDAWFYDMDNVRRPVSGQEVVTQLPTDTARIYPNTIYIVPDGQSQGIYVWNGQEFIDVANTNTDENVKSTPSEANKSYVVGSSDSEESTGPLTKNSKVYIDNSTGKLNAEGFTGGPADRALSADNASSADSAVADDKNQNIAKTYIKKLETKGTALTITYGDNTTTEINTQDTDTHNQTNIVFTSSNDSQENKVAANGEVCMNISDDNQLRSSHKIVGSGSIEVTSDAEGNLDIHGEDTWQPNTSNQPGYVAKGVPNRIWGTDESGNPSWVEAGKPYVHPDSEVDTGTYTKVTVDKQGHVVAGANPDTLSGYGIKDAASYIILPNNADLNSQLSSGFYVGLSGNDIANKPEGVDSFGMIVTKNSNGTYATQKLFSSGEVYGDTPTPTSQYTRNCVDNMFNSWNEDKLTDTVYTHPSGPGSMHIPEGGQAGQVLIWRSDGVAEWGNPDEISAEMMQGATETADGKSGIVPVPPAGPATAYLRNDGTWSTPPDTTYEDMVGVIPGRAGQSGLVPAPTTNDIDKFLCADGTWRIVDTSEYRPVWEEFTP